MNSAIQHRYVYVDESGDPYLSIEKQGTSKFYVVCAVIVEEVDLSGLLHRLEAIRKQYFGQSEMKSAGVSNDFEKRQAILKDFVSADLKFYAVVVDKAEIFPDSGLQWKKSFIKYIHGPLYRRIYRSFSSINISADEHGHPEFMASFKAYLEKRYREHLFERQHFAHLSSADSVGVQAADIIAGSLRRAYSGADPMETVMVLKDAAILIERWPPNAKTPDIIDNLADQEQFDHLIAERGLTLARSHVLDHLTDDDEDSLSRVEALKYLLWRYELDPAEYVERQIVLNHVNTLREEPLSMQAFSSRVIGCLRSEGVLISSSNQGCKIPSCALDMRQYVALVEGQVIPYIGRLAVARQELKFASTGKLDIVNAEVFPKLRKCMDALEDNNSIK